MPNTPSQIGNNPVTSPESPGYRRPEDATSTRDGAAKQARQDATTAARAAHDLGAAHGGVPKAAGR